MRKILQIFIVVMALDAATKVKAQIPKALVFGNFTIANPQDESFKKSFNTGYGVEAGAGIGFGKTMFIGSIGYISYSNTDFNTSTGNLKVVPIKVGIRQYLVGKLFINGNVGGAIQSYSKSSVTGTKFLYEVGAGVKLIKLLEVGVAYTSYETPGANLKSNSVLFKAGFSIKL